MHTEEWETDEEEGEEEEEVDCSEKDGDEGDQEEEGNEKEESSLVYALEDDSDANSDGETERCPVCLNRLLDQDVGTPEACDHNFCLECINEWAKVQTNHS